MRTPANAAFPHERRKTPIVAATQFSFSFITVFLDSELSEHQRRGLVAGARCCAGCGFWDTLRTEVPAEARRERAGNHTDSFLFEYSVLGSSTRIATGYSPGDQSLC
jgi:hypothetical protein